MAAPKRIIKKAEQLDRALAQVARLANEIEEWAEDHGADGADFFYENRLDMAYEFDLQDLLANLDELTD